MPGRLVLVAELAVVEDSVLSNDKVVAVESQFFAEIQHLPFFHLLVNDDNGVVDITAFDDALAGKCFNFREEAEGSGGCELGEELLFQVEESGVL